LADVEPSNTELAYRLAEIKEIVQDIPGRREYTEYQLRVEVRFKDQAEDIADLRKTHDEDIKAVHRRLDEDRQRRGADWRQLLYSGIAPFAVGILLLAITAWMSKGR
jgi:hypothetical protein